MEFTGSVDFRTATLMPDGTVRCAGGIPTTDKTINHVALSFDTKAILFTVGGAGGAQKYRQPLDSATPVPASYPDLPEADTGTRLAIYRVGPLLAGPVSFQTMPAAGAYRTPSSGIHVTACDVLDSGSSDEPGRGIPDVAIALALSAAMSSDDEEGHRRLDPAPIDTSPIAYGTPGFAQTPLLRWPTARQPRHDSAGRSSACVSSTA